ncbi:MAG TPA: hypothetical protein VMV49_00645 [Candidatus Deferrimicrobium sp.]|nr:hypothetical protein [Candidatus Deferrimicrobium sp.]
MKNKDKFFNILKDLSNRRYFILWLKTLLKKSNPVKKQIPFIPFRAQEWLIRFLKSDMRVFEYGSGGSTLFITKRVKSIVSIEHDKKWYQYINAFLKESVINNCEYFLIEPEFKDLMFRSSYLTFNQLLFKPFKKYITQIDEYPDSSFDLVSVDGKARNFCVKYAIRKVRKGGILLLDDSNLGVFRPSLEFLKNYPKRDFYGLCPFVGFNQTTVWKIT